MKRSIWLLILLNCLLALPLVSGTKKGPVLPSDCDAIDDIGRTFILTAAEAGGGAPHNNLPSCQVVYFWRRVP